jgi:hypothetical protein
VWEKKKTQGKTKRSTAFYGGIICNFLESKISCIDEWICERSLDPSGVF